MGTASGRAVSKTYDDSIDNIFKTYANRSLGMIDPEGIEALCSAMKMDHTDVRILMLAWKMKAEKQGYFTQDEWRRGMEALNVDTIRKLKKALSKLEKEVLTQENFKDFYNFAFCYSLTEERQKCIEIESICMLLDIVFGSKFRLQVDLFIEYLKVQTDYKVMTMDQWVSFYRFCTEIKFPDLKDYDTCQAWPSILDDFVDWMKAKAT